MMLQYLDPLPRFLTRPAFSPPSLQDAIAVSPMSKCQKENQLAGIRLDFSLVLADSTLIGAERKRIRPSPFKL